MKRTLREEEALKLLDAAKKARKAAYCPYSGFAVGAALLTEEGNVVTGCNVENAAYSATLCAEHTALACAVAAGYRRFRAVAVAGGPQGEKDPKTPCPPCGACRQILAEFCDPEDMTVVLQKEDGAAAMYTLGDLLPMKFGRSLR